MIIFCLFFNATNTKKKQKKKTSSDKSELNNKLTEAIP